ncbi:MAG: hypothetical protein QGI06_01290 [Rhodospirillales bacterium]|jgi:hypothetical protein|nr:hypothetical protein [Rhodospirillales bacterium]|tara:strand:+ start:407 stop:820 length:414 start_codon:yes stop_codon:yes gene_type:complete
MMVAGRDSALRGLNHYDKVPPVKIMGLKRPSKRGSRLQDARSMFEAMIKDRNFYSRVAILAFVVSGGLSVWAFFFISDLSLWGEVNEYVALGIISMSWVLIFPIWILAFLSVMSVLHAMGIRDLRAISKDRLPQNGA